MLLQPRPHYKLKLRQKQHACAETISCCNQFCSDVNLKDSVDMPVQRLANLQKQEWTPVDVFLFEQDRSEA